MNRSLAAVPSIHPEQQLLDSPCRRSENRYSAILTARLAALVLVAVGVASPLALPADVTRVGASGTATEEEGHEGHVRCPDCDEDGHHVCPRCDGKKKLERDCHRCEGEGVRPCSHCSRKGDGQGLLDCGFCSGRGTVGKKTPRSCPKCAGSGTAICPTCDGDGEIKCPPKVYDGACPRCKYAGHVTCTLCAGKKWLRETELERRLKETSSEDRPRRDGGKTGDSRDGHDQTPTTDAKSRRGATKTASAGAALTTPALESRLRSLSNLRAREEPFALGDLLQRSNAYLKALRELNASLEEADAARDGELAERIEVLLARVRSLRSRYDSALKDSTAFAKSYQRAERRWTTRPVDSGKNRRTMESWRMDMDFSLKQAERKAAALARSPSARVLALAEEIDADLALLRQGVESELARLSEKRQQAREAAQAAKRSRLEDEQITAGTRGAALSEKPDAEALAAETPEGDGGEARQESGGLRLGSLLLLTAALGALTLLAVWLWQRRPVPAEGG